MPARVSAVGEWQQTRQTGSPGESRPSHPPMAVACVHLTLGCRRPALRGTAAGTQYSSPPGHPAATTHCQAALSPEVLQVAPAPKQLSLALGIGGGLGVPLPGAQPLQVRKGGGRSRGPDLKSADPSGPAACLAGWQETCRPDPPGANSGRQQTNKSKSS